MYRGSEIWTVHTKYGHVAILSPLLIRSALLATSCRSFIVKKTMATTVVVWNKGNLPGPRLFKLFDRIFTTYLQMDSKQKTCKITHFETVALAD